MVYGEALEMVDVGKRRPAPETGEHEVLETGQNAPAERTTALPVSWSVVYHDRRNNQERLSEEQFRIAGKKPVTEMIEFIVQELPHVQAENAKTGVLNLAKLWIMHEGSSKYKEDVIRAIERRLADNRCIEELIRLVEAKKSRRMK